MGKGGALGSGILFGVAFAVVAIGLSIVLGERRGSSLLAILLAGAAAVYLGASLGDLPGSAVLSTIAFVFFGGMALYGMEDARLLAAGWFGHTFWDLLHVFHILDSAVPHWYGSACLVADPLIGVYVCYLVLARRRLTVTHPANPDL